MASEPSKPSKPRSFGVERSVTLQRLEVLGGSPDSLGFASVGLASLLAAALSLVGVVSLVSLVAPNTGGPALVTEQTVQGSSVALGGDPCE